MSALFLAVALEAGYQHFARTGSYTSEGPAFWYSREEFPKTYRGRRIVRGAR